MTATFQGLRPVDATAGPARTGANRTVAATVSLDDMVKARRLARAVAGRLADPAVSADDVVSMILIALVESGELPTLSAAVTMVDDVNRSAAARTERETAAATGTAPVRSEQSGTRATGRVRRVTRTVAYFRAVSVARLIVDRGPALSVPTGGPGRVLALSARGVTSDSIRDTVRNLSVALATTDPVTARPVRPWTCRAGCDIGTYGPCRDCSGLAPADRHPVHGPAPASGTGTRFTTVVQSILSDGRIQRPDVDAARWLAGRNVKPAPVEATAGVTRMPRRIAPDVPVTAGDVARHQIATGCERATVRLIREPRLSRMLDKRTGWHAERATAEAAADLSRPMVPSATGVQWRTWWQAFFSYVPVSGRGALDTVARAVRDTGTTVGRVAAEHAYSPAAGGARVQWSDACRSIGLDPTTAHRDALRSHVTAAAEHAHRATGQLRTGAPGTVTYYAATGTAPVTVTADPVRTWSADTVATFAPATGTGTPRPCRCGTCDAARLFRFLSDTFSGR